MRQSPDGSPGVPRIVASPSAVPDAPRPGETRSSAASGSAVAVALRSSAAPARPESDEAPGIDAQGEVANVDAVLAVSQRRRTGQSDLPAIALRG